MDTIFQRRSVRKFLEKKISEEDIKRILKAGMAAPSCKASCEWVFVVMRDRERFQKFLEVHPYATALKTADTVILVCADLNLEKEPGEGWWIQDCSAAMQNMLLEATDLSIGSLWLGVHPKQERIDFIKELCCLPDHVEPLGMVVLGTAAKEKSPIDRYLEDQVFYEIYQGEE